jgi:hypothetical protein
LLAEISLGESNRLISNRAYWFTDFAYASTVYVTVNGSPVVLWNTNALPVNSRVPELIPVPFISMGMSTRLEM